MMNTKNILAGLVIAASLAACGSKNNPKPQTQPIVVTPNPGIEDKGWTFETTPVFADEFSVAGSPNADNWGYDNGGGGWGNAELEYYTPTNAAVADGKLTITAKKETLGGMGYTSTRMVSKNLGSIKYGRIEVKAKLPSGRGTWPAIWMLADSPSPYGNWPKSGEIDIMEMVGFDPGNVHFTVHNETYNGANGQGDGKIISTASSDYHVYRVDWTPFAVRGYFDDVLVYTYKNNGQGTSVYPYDQKFHLLLNIAVGGSWGGQKGVDDTAFPTTMDVDYVHFYKMIDK